MLGWGIYIYKDGIKTKGLYLKDISLVSWTSSINGLDWIKNLVKEGKAEDLGGDGYPCRYRIKAREILFLTLPPKSKKNDQMVIGDNYAMDSNWTGDVQIDLSELRKCSPDGVLVVEAWDQS